MTILTDAEVLVFLGLPVTVRTLPEPDIRAVVERLMDLTHRVARLEADGLQARAEGTPK